MNNFFCLELFPNWLLEVLIIVIISAAKVTFLLGFVALLCFAFRCTSAMRHHLWFFALSCSLLLPFIPVINGLALPILPSDLFLTNSTQAKRPAESFISNPNLNTSSILIQPIEREAVNSSAIEIDNLTMIRNENAPFRYYLLSCFFILWCLGMSFFIFKFLAGYLGTRRLVRQAKILKDPSWNNLLETLTSEIELKKTVLLLQNKAMILPVTCGILNPVVLLPPNADEWTEEKRRVVLLHELTHIKRRDCLTLLLAQTACAIYWFNPVFWFAASRLRIEREFACDDYVISLGQKRSDYAQHLLDIANSVYQSPTTESAMITVVPMAQQYHLEKRVQAVLSASDKYSTGYFRATIYALSVVLMFLLLGGLQPVIDSTQNTNNLNAEPEKQLNSAASAIPKYTRLISPELSGNEFDNKSETGILDSINHDLATIDLQEKVGSVRKSINPIEEKTKTLILSKPKSDFNNNLTTGQHIADSLPRTTKDFKTLPDVKLKASQIATLQENINHQSEDKPGDQKRSPYYQDNTFVLSSPNYSTTKELKMKTPVNKGYQIPELTITNRSGYGRSVVTQRITVNETGVNLSSEIGINKDSDNYLKKLKKLDNYLKKLERLGKHRLD